MIDIKPIRVKEYTTEQSKYSQAAKIPFRSVVLGPSGAGKGILIQNMILNIYKDCFQRIYVFSPSFFVDATWRPVERYQEEVMKAKHTKEEQLYFDHYDPYDLEQIIDRQHKLINKMKSENYKKLFSILVIVDDFADDPSFSRNSKHLHSLYTRGRHNSISTIVSTQKYNAIHPIIRINATELYVFRLRSVHDLDVVLHENSANVGSKNLEQIYKMATEQPFSFLYINLRAKRIEDMFFIKFDKKLKVEKIV